MKVFYTILTILIFVHQPILSQHMQKRISYVNPLIGTDKMGHTFPGATAPFGSIQLSPETDTLSYVKNGKYNPEVYKYCSGYNYADKTIVGFSATHFNGTGHSDLGDLLIMPTVGALQLNPGTALNPESGYRSRFSKEKEHAEAGFYQVWLDDYKINAELTASKRVAMHRYTFPKSSDAHIIFDLMAGIYNYDGKNVWTYVRVENDSLITGFRQTSGWARTRTVYFAMRFSKPFKSYGQKNFEEKQPYIGFWKKFDQTKNFPEIAGRALKLFFDFDTEQNESIEIHLAISPVSQANAVMNLAHEVGNKNFDGIKAETQKEWEDELSRIIIHAEKNVMTNFYTAMYHAFINPTEYMDVNGEYKGLDQNTHKAADFKNYTTFSMWDTFRSLHPLFNIIQPKRNNDMIHAMMAHYNQFSMKMLPIWSHYANENWCMSGYHSVSVVADAIIKGNYSGNALEALMACVATANKRSYEGIGPYIDKGFIPFEMNRYAVSNALEYAYDDWTIAQLAKHLGQKDIYNTFIKRSENWRINFDKSIGFMRPRTQDDSFKKDFDPLNTENQGFIEGNAWNYSFFVPHNIPGLIEVMGGKDKFNAKLTELFTMYLPDSFFAHTEDITREGIIGGYVHGNEPAHHVSYLYNWSGQPWKTQEQVRKILEMQYKPTPDGLGGNDDTGQMSAWYIFSALGFYPVAPASDFYSIGSPVIENAILNLENGNIFQIEVQNQSSMNIYVQKVLLNDKPLTDFQIKHQDIMNGGKLKFVMGPKPVKK